MYSEPAYSPGIDGRRDTREDLRADEISPYILDDPRNEAFELGDPALQGGGRGELSRDFGDAEADAEIDIDPWDAVDAQLHRKKMAVWSLSAKRRNENEPPSRRAAHRSRR